MGFAFGNIGDVGGPFIGDMRYRGPDEFPGYFDQPSPGDESPMPSPPGYQQPPVGQQPQQPQQPAQQGYEQYFKQMRQNLDGLSDAFKQIEGMQMPGGQYNPPGGIRGSIGLFGSGGK